MKALKTGLTQAKLNEFDANAEKYKKTRAALDAEVKSTRAKLDVADLLLGGADAMSKAPRSVLDRGAFVVDASRAERWRSSPPPGSIRAAPSSRCSCVIVRCCS